MENNIRQYMDGAPVNQGPSFHENEVEQQNNFNRYEPYIEEKQQNNFNRYQPQQHIQEEVKTPNLNQNKKDDAIRCKLTHPFEFEGDYYEEVIMDFNKLTGADIESILDTENIQAYVLETDKRFHAALAMKAAGLPKDFLKFVAAKDYLVICLHAQSFIME